VSACRGQNWYRVPDNCTVRDAEIMAALVDGRPSRGLWKCRNLLRRQSKPWNHKRIDRVYCQMKLNHRRQALHIVIDTSITSMRLLRISERLQAEHGLPQVLRNVNGPEFLGEAFTSWAKNAGMAIQYIQPGKPNQNAYIERFNRPHRDELLD
jgi:putative transposase